jgi:hypothetical protein
MMRQVAYALENLANIAILRGEYAHAAMHFHEGLGLTRELGDRHLTVYLLSDLTKLAVARGHHTTAARLGGGVAGLREQLGIGMPLAEDQDRERSLARAREALGTARFERTWADGHVLSLEAATAYALEEIGAPEPANYRCSENDLENGSQRNVANRPTDSRSLSGTLYQSEHEAPAVALNQGRLEESARPAFRL